MIETKDIILGPSTVEMKESGLFIQPQTILSLLLLGRRSLPLKDIIQMTVLSKK